MRRGLLALLLAFGWLFATPAHATPLVTGDTVQFSYTWGSVTRTFTDAVVTVTVQNDITNKIGYGGEVIDTYRITFGSQVIEVTEKHGPRDYVFTVSGTQDIVLEGIDRGFWAGFYGPIMTVSASPIAQQEEPSTQSPQSESATLSDALSQSPPAEPQTQSQESLSSESTVVTPQPEPLPSPTPSAEPTLEPSPTPAPSLPEQPQEVTPSQAPTASSPTQSPEPEPTQSPTPSATPQPTSQAPQILEPTPQASTTSQPQFPQVSEPPSQSIEVISEEPFTTTPQVIEVSEEAFGGSLSEAVQAAVTQAVEAVGKLVEAFATAGLDMTPEQREEAQDLVVSSVIVSQVATGIRKIK